MNKAYPNIKQVAFIALMLVILSVVITYVFANSFGKLLSYDLLALIAYSITFILVIYFTISEQKDRISNQYLRNKFPISFKLGSKPKYLAMFISMIFLIFINEFLNSLIPMPSGIKEFFKESLKPTFVNYFAILIAAPIFEEILTRGLVLKGLLRIYTPVKAIVVSSVFFAFIHLNPWLFLSAFSSSLLLGYVYYKSKSIVPSIWIHFTYNGVTTLLVHLYKLRGEKFQTSDIFGQQVYYYFFLAFCLICLVISVRYLSQILNREYSESYDLVIATNNKHKFEEIAQIIPKKINLLDLKSISCFEDIEETADTLKGNASIKSTHVYQNYNKFCFSDDTGLEVEALGGAPGVYSARYAGKNASYEQNVDKLLSEMQGVENRNACFKTVISLIIDEQEYFFEGRVDGVITQDKYGNNGFGYDPVFMPLGYNKTFAQMSAEEKSQISHRARAVEKLVDFLNKY